MPVHVKLSSILRRYVPDYDPTKGLVLESGKGKTIRQLMKEVGIPPEKVSSIVVNHMPAQPGYVVKDGDRIALVLALGGG